MSRFRELRAQMAAQKMVGRRVTVVAKGQRIVGIICRATLALAAQERDGVQYKAGDLTRCRVATTHGVYSVRAIERVGLKPEEILYVGDHRHLDLDPARALGIQAYLVDRKGKGGDYAIPSLLELLRIAGLR